MGSLRAEVTARRAEILRLVEKHRGRSVAIFGSVARGEDSSTSDIDFLVEFEPDSSLFDLLHLQDDLGSLFERDVDVVSVGALKKRDDHIRESAIPL